MKHLEVSKVMGVPPIIHSYFGGSFHQINHPAIGVPPWPWKPPISQTNRHEPPQYRCSNIHPTSIYPSKNHPQIIKHHDIRVKHHQKDIKRSKKNSPPRTHKNHGAQTSHGFHGTEEDPFCAAATAACCAISCCILRSSSLAIRAGSRVQTYGCCQGERLYTTNHHFYGWYKPFPNGWFIMFFNHITKFCDFLGQKLDFVELKRFVMGKNWSLFKPISGKCWIFLAIFYRSSDLEGNPTSTLKNDGWSWKGNPTKTLEVPQTLAPAVPAVPAAPSFRARTIMSAQALTMSVLGIGMA